MSEHLGLNLFLPLSSLHIFTPRGLTTLKAGNGALSRIFSPALSPGRQRVSPLTRRNYPRTPTCSAAPPRLRPHGPHPLRAPAAPRQLRPSACATAGAPPRPSRDCPALNALSDWLSRPRGWVLAYSPAPQRGCSFQTSTVSSGHRLRCRRREPPHRGTGHNCWPLSRRVKVGPTTLGATSRITGLELENKSCGGHRRGAGREPPWRGQPRENLLRPERSVSFASRDRGPAATGGWAPGCDSEPLNPPPLFWVWRLPLLTWEGGVTRRDADSVGRFGSLQNADPRPGGGGLGLCNPSGGPTAPGLSPLSGWSLASLVPSHSGLGRPVVLPTPSSVGAPVCACARRPLACPGSPRVASRGGSLPDFLARAPFHVASMWSFLSLPRSQLWCGHRTCSHLVDASCSQLPFVSRKFVLIPCGVFSYCL